MARARLGGEQLELVNADSLTPALDVYGFGLTARQPADWFVEFSQQVLDAAAARVRELAPELSCILTSTMGYRSHVLSAASEGASISAPAAGRAAGGTCS